MVETPQAQIFVFRPTHHLIPYYGQASHGIHMWRLEGCKNLHRLHIHPPYVVVPGPIVEGFIPGRLN